MDKYIGSFSAMFSPKTRGCLNKIGVGFSKYRSVHKKRGWWKSISLQTDDVSIVIFINWYESLKTSRCINYSFSKFCRFLARYQRHNTFIKCSNVWRIYCRICCKGTKSCEKGDAYLTLKKYFFKIMLSNVRFITLRLIFSDELFISYLVYQVTSVHTNYKSLSILQKSQYPSNNFTGWTKVGKKQNLFDGV